MKALTLFSVSLLILISGMSIAQTKSMDQSISITKEKLALVTTLDEIIPDFPGDKMSIAKFRLTIIEKAKNPQEFGLNGNRWSKQIKEVLLSLPAGSKIYMEYIKGKMIDSDNEVAFHAVAFQITEK